MQALDLPPDQFEVLIVDNGSTDDTGKVAQSFCSVPRFRYLVEADAGLSRARNRAWRETDADLVAYIDDDAVASKRWLSCALAALLELPQIGCVGGRTLPLWETKRPRWLTDDLLMYLSTVDWSPAPRVLAPDEWLVGTNIAFRRDLLERMGGFREDLGRIGKRLYSMEDIDAQRKVQSIGMNRFYDPHMEVAHYVPAQRATRGWFVRRCFFQGVSRARMIGSDNGRLAGSLQITPRVRAAAARSLSGGAFSMLCRTAELSGFLSGVVRLK